MDQSFVLDRGLELARHRLVSRIHVGEIGVAAAFGRYFQGVEDGGFGRHVDIGHVGVPDRFTRAEIADWPAVLNDVGDDIDLGKFLVERLAIGIGAGRIQLAEIRAEGEQLRIGEALIARHDHEMAVQRFADGEAIMLAQGLGQIDAAELGAKRFEIPDRQSHRVVRSELAAAAGMMWR